MFTKFTEFIHESVKTLFKTIIEAHKKRSAEKDN